MAHNFLQSNAAVNAGADAIGALLNDGYLRIYNGTQIATANTAVTTQTKLAEMRYSNPAFGAASAGVISANAIAGDSSADATGTATWFLALKSDGVTPVWCGSAGEIATDLILSDADLVAGGPVEILSHTFTQPKS